MVSVEKDARMEDRRTREGVKKTNKKRVGSEIFFVLVNVGSEI